MEGRDRAASSRDEFICVGRFLPKRLVELKSAVANHCAACFMVDLRWCEFALGAQRLAMTEFFARADEQFMTRGRQSPQQIVTTALSAIDGSAPTVVSGWQNKILAPGYRFMPREPALLTRDVNRATR
jgi:hypothetical protein